MSAALQDRRRLLDSFWPFCVTPACFLSPYVENSMIRPKSFVAAELKKETENDTSIYSSTWCLVRDRHHLFNGSISIYGYLQRNQTIENASLPAALMGKIKGHPNFFFFPRKIAILISLRGKGHAWLAASCANFLRCLYCFWLPPLASDSEDAACSSSNSAVMFSVANSPCSIFSRVVTKYKIFCRRHACVHFEWSTRN